MTTIRPTSERIRRTAPPLAPFARGPVLGAMTAVLVVLAVLAPLYGYHRDELYFRMLPPAWGYTDQPPLTPLLAHAAIAVFGDSVVALRIVSLLCAVASIVLLALITREAGGDRSAQAFTAWGMAGATLTLLFGHVLLTASLDLVVWPATLLCVTRAVLRDDGRWWLVAGAVVGVSSFNKLLVVVLLVGIAVGLVVVGPRRWFGSWRLWGGVALAGVIALPNAVFQALNGWPQLAMGAALAENNAAEVRVMMWPFLILLVGPVLAVFWITAVVGLLRRPEWRPIRFLVVTFAVVVAFVFAAGTQFYYTAGMLATLTAIGSVSVSAWARTRGRRIFVVSALVFNAAGCAVTSLPLLPVEVFGASGLAAVNSASADQVGWEHYVAQIVRVAEASDADVVIASNYGEAGALDRFRNELPPVVSGHNALWVLASPPADTTTVVIVGGQAARATAFFVTCTVADRLDNGVGVDNEEEGQPITVCSAPIAPLHELWPSFAHLD